MPQLAVDGAALTYDDEGPRDGEGVPLVFIHGWTANRHRWDHQMAHFAAEAAGRYGSTCAGTARAAGRGRGRSKSWPGMSSPSSTTWRSTGSCSSATPWAG